MALVPHKITALAESDAEGTDGKNIVAGAVVSLYDTDGAAVTLFDTENGANGSTAKQTDSTGQVVVWVTAGEYDEEVNGSIKRRVLVGSKNITIEQLIESVRKYQEGDYINPTGYYTSGDGGDDQLVATSTTGLTPSQSPADRGEPELVDGSGRLWKFTSEQINAKSLGLSTDSADNSPVLNAIGDNRHVIIDSGEYLTTQFSLGNNVTLSGQGATLKVVDGSSQNPLMFLVNGKENVKVIGITFDGNTSNITNFNNVNLSYLSSNIEFIDCEFKSCRGIALFASGGSGVHVKDSHFEDCGLYHLISGSGTDRKQAFACQGVVNATAKDNTFKNIGLDCISFATSCENVTASGNEIDTNYAGSIYISNTNTFKVYGNTVSNKTGGGNGVDCVNSSNGEVFGNHCYENGAAGILFSDCVKVECFGNTCFNNYQSGSSVHRGGITVGSISECSSVNIHGNTCYDDQGAGSVTQRYSIGVYTDGGAYSRIRIDENNDFKGYDASGNEDFSNVIQNSDIGFCGYPYQVNLADQAEIKLFEVDEAISSFTVSQVNGGIYGQFYNRLGQAVSKILDPSSGYEVTDTGTTQAVYNDAGTLKLKNRTGLTRTYLIQPLSFTVV